MRINNLGLDLYLLFAIAHNKYKCFIVILIYLFFYSNKKLLSIY